MKYTIQKTIALIITLLVVAFLTFLAFEVIPGDSAEAMLGMDATEEEIAALREELGLNKPFVVRYIQFIGDAVRGDFGTSLQYGIAVNDLLAARLPITIGLAVIAFVLMIVISIPIGLFAGGKEGSAAAGGITFLSQFVMAIPPFFLGMLLTLLFGIVLKWFTPGRYTPFSENAGEYMKGMFFPALALALPKIAMTVQFLRSSVARQKKMDYVRTARSKGNSKRRTLTHHILQNALIPVVTFLGMEASDLLAGSIVIEQVFNLSGVGRLLVVSITNRDFPVVQAIILYIAATVILMNYLVDMLYHVLDPRVRE